MALLSLNGVPVEAMGSDWEPVRLGDVVRSFNGTPRQTARVKKRDFHFSSSLLALDVAVALRGLVDGDGHVLNFEDASGYLYTSRQLPPASSTGATRATTGARLGGAFLSVASNASLSWAVGVAGYEDGQGSVLGWVKEGGGAWKHVVALPSGAVFTNGVQTAASGGYAFARCLAGTLTLGDFNASGTTTAFDDVVALPYPVPAAWVPFLYAFHSTRAWPELPAVLAQGPRFPTAGLVVIGQTVPGRCEPLLATVGESFDFTLFGT